MGKIDLQAFAEVAKQAVQGTKLVYLYRIQKEATSSAGATLAFTTENERTMSKDADSTMTKDGSIRTPGNFEQEITATSILSTTDTLIAKLEEALDNGDLIELWEANLELPADEGENKFKGKYFQGYITEISISSPSDGHVEVSLTFGINGTGAAGDVTVTTEQQEEASYVFKDTTQSV